MSDTETMTVSYAVTGRADDWNCRCALFLGDATWVLFAPIGSGRVAVRLVKYVTDPVDASMPVVLVEREMGAATELAPTVTLLAMLAHGGGE